MINSWIVVLPPLLVLGCAAATRNVIVSLILGALSAALIATDFSVANTITKTLSTLAHVTIDLDNLYLFGFLILLGAIIEMMTHAGGITAYTQALSRYIKSKKTTETTSLLLSNIFFLDDYLNGLTVGSIMRPLTDKMNIPRVKLAFLVNAMSAPLCLLIPATTWVAIVLGQLQLAGVSDNPADNPIINADPVATYLNTIPFIFYSILIVFSAWFIVRRRIAFGTMKKHESIAEKTGNLFGGQEPLSKRDSNNLRQGSISGFFIPIGTFIISMLFFLFYSGDAALLGGDNSLIIALKNADSFWALFCASALTFTLSATLFVAKKELSLRDLAINCWHGFELMQKSLIVLILAYTFSAILIHDLHTGAYLAHLISGTLPLFALPVVVFLVSTLISASIGSSWGTILVMLPLTIRMLAALADGTGLLLIADIPNFYPTLGGLLAGSVAGAHFSPITDATIMASTSAGCYHMDHVQTQISYSLPALVGSSLAFLVAGILGSVSSIWNYGLIFGIGITTTTLLLLVRNK